MPGLLDIAPSREIVNIRETDIEISGVSAQGFVELLARFPELRKLMTGMELEVEAIFSVAGAAIAPIIAAGTGLPGDKKAEEVAGSLSLDEQAILIEAIFRQTFPKGIQSFVERLGGLAQSLGAGASPTAPVTK
jgi:hypothetical protein